MEKNLRLEKGVEDIRSQIEARILELIKAGSKIVRKTIEQSI